MNSRSISGGEPEIRERLIDAAERVWADTPPSKVTMRRIADEAGVSAGLVYHYFDSKEDFIGVVLERVAERLSQAAQAGESGEERLTALWAAMEASPAFHRLMTWRVLEGQNALADMSRRAVIDDMAAEAHEQQAADPALVGGMIAFMGISMLGYERLVNRATGRDEDDPALRKAVLAMFADWFDAQIDPPGD